MSDERDAAKPELVHHVANEFGLSGGGVGQVERFVRAPVAPQIYGDHAEAFGENGRNAAPTVGGCAEPVQQDNRRA
jgi:hypothetical protein